MTTTITQLTISTSALDGGNGTNIKSLASSSDGDYLYAGTYGDGVLKSIDNGITWTATPRTTGSTTGLACSANGQIVYATHLGTALYRSTNYGEEEEWTAVCGNSYPLNIPGYAGYNGENITAIACDSTGTKLIMAPNGAGYIFTSVDSGATWRNVYSGVSGVEQAQVTCNGDFSLLFAAFNNGDGNIYKNGTDGLWTQKINGSINGPWNNIASNAVGDKVFAVPAQSGIGVYIFTNSSYQLITNSTNISLVSPYNSGNNFLIMTNGGPDEGKSRTYSITYPPIVITNVPCFKEDSKILIFESGYEVYKKIQDLRIGDLVKTVNNGYIPVIIIGTTKLYNSGNNLRGVNRLYKCSKSNYPEITEDLFITGYHSILVDNLSDKEREELIELVGKIYITDNKYRLLTCLDSRAKPYEEEGLFNIYHIALENNDYYMNYGIYANGLLVETSSKRNLKELSGMTLLE
jgi:hypothetical protein